MEISFSERVKSMVLQHIEARGERPKELHVSQFDAYELPELPGTTLVAGKDRMRDGARAIATYKGMKVMFDAEKTHVE